MKILIVGGDLKNNKKDVFAKQIYNTLKEYNPKLINGNINQLKSIFDTISKYEIIYWLIENNIDFYDIKKIAPLSIIVTKKKKSENFKEDLDYAIRYKSNLVISIDNNYKLFDVLGNEFYDGNDLEKLTKISIQRLTFLKNITRQKTISVNNKSLILNWYFDAFKENETKIDKQINFQVNDDFLTLINDYSNDFRKIMGEKIIKPKDAPQVGRCLKGMPSFRYKNFIIVSKREVKNNYLKKEDFVATLLNDELYYFGEDKPSIDSPIHLNLYKELPNINFIIHSHCYIKNAQFSKTAIPCGSIEQFKEIMKMIKNKNETRYAFNLIGHGAIIMGQTIEDLKNIEYIARNIPEKITD